MTRLSEVAKFAGVSEASVRRVLNERPGTTEATRNSVLTAIDVLGYTRPTPMRSKKSRLVGLVVPDLQNPIFPAFIEVLCAALNKRELLPVLCTRTADGVSESTYIDMLLKQDTAGIVFVGGSYADAGPEQCARLREIGLPTVLINAADENTDVCQVWVDDAIAVDQSLDHLTALGHERIGLILGPAGHMPSMRKLAAYVGYWERRGIDVDWRRLVAHTVFSMEGGSTAVNRLLAEGVTAVVCGSDALGLGAIRAARRRGLEIPEDLSVVGFDDSPHMVVTEPPLTTARQPVRAMAAAVMASLMSQINGRPVPTEPLLFEPELIVRNSTGVPRPRG
ncbi:LacI family DNA-binding transcriptional regulator [Streptacidiphilus sp. N1-3]|uniref:LacI family DNA-binding transcriptional regulator n=1 Tax=Streptacidiphilus alkalitolerans TaxID=3342712 RepID=A0ABV6X3B1_9ACTN